jgi:2-amino-4-hydroxy-6-hydroxymethyldihydropteridine diphosphokinase
MILLGLGSNMGDREKNLEAALRLLEEGRSISIYQISAIYETAPFGVTDQADFLNMVAEITTKLSPYQLLDKCLAVETLLGRIRTRPWGPRVIDLDLLVYDDIQLNEAALQLPHPGIFQRAFVLIPILDIVPQDMRIAGKTASNLEENLALLANQKLHLWKRVRWDSRNKCFA